MILMMIDFDEKFLYATRTSPHFSPASLPLSSSTLHLVDIHRSSGEQLTSHGHAMDV